MNSSAEGLPADFPALHEWTERVKQAETYEEKIEAFRGWFISACMQSDRPITTAEEITTYYAQEFHLPPGSMSFAASNNVRRKIFSELKPSDLERFR